MIRDDADGDGSDADGSHGAVMGSDLVAQARAASDSRYRRSPAGSMRRAARWLGEAVGEVVGELLVWLVAMALFSGAVALTVWGWNQSRLATIGVYVALAAFLAYGVTVLWQSRRSAPERPTRTRIRTAAAITVVAVAIWLSYALPYR